LKDSIIFTTLHRTHSLMLSFTRDLGNKQMLSGQKLMMPNNALEIYSGQQLERNNFTKSFL